MEEKENKELDYVILREDFPSYDLKFKVIIIGNSCSGKSCLSMRGTRKEFSNGYNNTIVSDSFNFCMRLYDKIIKLEIVDTCGQDVYRSLIKNYYKDCSLAIIVYAIDE